MHNILSTKHSHSRASPDSKEKPAKKRMTISLSGQVAETLEKMAESQEITQNEALSKAIAISAYLLEQKELGSKILIKKANNEELTELVFL